MMNLVRIFGLFVAVMAAPLHAQIMSGPATIIDGDTIDMTGTRIRLLGIDAPEAKQACTRNGVEWACGAEATATLTEIIGNQSLTCTAQGFDVDGRTLATCQTRMFEIGREAVRRGMAVLLDNAPDDYQEAAAVARQMNYGLWAAEFQQPADWRAANPAAVERVARAESTQRTERAAPARPAPPKRYTNTLGCAIKGNHSIRGEWIYHLPGQTYYNQTRPEALFCTEREAQASGYRRSKE
jgi:endonuclease YncB( thermonuclease family)